VTTRTRDPRGPAVLVATLVLYCAVCVALPSVWRGDAKISDVPVYERYGDAIQRGAVPYRDFRPEYPPAALAAFVVPSLLTNGDVDYARAFAVEMALLGALGIVLAFVALQSIGATGPSLVAGMALASAAPLLLGPLALTRFDFFPAALVAGALAALVAGRDRLGAGVLGAAIGVKLYPAVLVPLLVAWVWRRRGRREALVALAVCLGVVAVVFAPFVALAPDGVGWSLWRQLGRPLQIESLGAAALLALHHGAGLEIHWRSANGSQNLVGTSATVASVVTSVVEAAVLLWVWVQFGRRKNPEVADLVLASAAALVLFVALGKVLSPQFLIWLLVPVALVSGRRAFVAIAILVVACALTHVWFPDRYWRLVFHFDTVASWLVVARDFLLVALLAVLLWELRRGRESARST
jgi:hypothetical protein